MVVASGGCSGIFVHGAEVQRVRASLTFVHTPRLARTGMAAHRPLEDTVALRDAIEDVYEHPTRASNVSRWHAGVSRRRVSEAIKLVRACGALACVPTVGVATPYPPTHALPLPQSQLQPPMVLCVGDGCVRGLAFARRPLPHRHACTHTRARHSHPAASILLMPPPTRRRRAQLPPGLENTDQRSTLRRAVNRVLHESDSVHTDWERREALVAVHVDGLTKEAAHREYGPSTTWIKRHHHQLEDLLKKRPAPRAGDTEPSRKRRRVAVRQAADALELPGRGRRPLLTDDEVALWGTTMALQGEQSPTLVCVPRCRVCAPLALVRLACQLTALLPPQIRSGTACPGVA